jgi:group I intron endonuclease
MYSVYCITNKLTGKHYIGKDKSFPKRWRDHKNYAKGGKEKYPQHFQYLHASMAHYGIDNFEINVLEEFDDEEDANKYEMFWISLLLTNNREYGYNLTRGGEGSSGRVCKDETKKKISAANKANERYIGSNNPFYGKTHSEESKKVIGQKSKGRCAGEKNFWFGKHFHANTRKKISEGKIGKPGTFIGKHHTEQSKKKISDAVKARISENKLTDQEVRDIRRMLTTGKLQQEIADIFDIDCSTVSRIKTGKSYGHVK